MNLQYDPSGTAAKANRDSILASELAKLQKYKARMKGENDRYLEGHPEMRPLLDEFVGAIMRDKPSDIIKYGALFFSTLRTQSVMGQSPLVITGPPTIGKTMFIRMLIDKYPNTFGTAVQHTTRVKREGEVQGVDHFFVDKASFEESVRNGDFADYYTLHTNLYATSLKAVEKVRADGKICVLDTTAEGVERVKSSNLECKFLFIGPSSIEAYEARQRQRGQDTEEKLQIKVQQARDDVAFSSVPGRFDAILINDDKDVAFEELTYILQGWYPDIEDATSLVAVSAESSQA